MIIRAAFMGALLLFNTGVTPAQAPQEQKPATASIAGKVLVSGKPARGITVSAVRKDVNERDMFQRMLSGFAGLMFRAQTDDAGDYRIESLEAGRYEVFVIAPAMVTPPAAEESAAVNQAAKRPTVTRSEDEEDDDDDDEKRTAMSGKVTSVEKQVNLGEAEAVKDVNFSIQRGGVITGRVTHADGRPVIGETVELRPMEGNPPGRSFAFDFGSDTFATDDRGIYRIYGVTDGRYKVSVSSQPKGFMDMVAKKTRMKTTYYPGVTDEALALTVEVKNGGEVRGLDIKLGTADSTFAVSGRVIDAATGRPLPDVQVAYEGPSTTFGKANAPTNARGEFKLTGLASGQYRLSNVQDILGQGEYYSESAPFEIKEADVSGIELKMHRGMTVSGVAVIEGATAPSEIAKLAQMEIIAFSTSDAPQAPGEQFPTSNYAHTRVGPDGGFAFRGVRPGKVRITTYSAMSEVTSRSTKLTLTRIERGGVELRGEMELRQGETVTDLRLVFSPANGVLRGQVRAEDGSSLKGIEISVSAVRAGSGQDDWMDRASRGGTEVDPNGNFVIEGLLAGEYEVTVSAMLLPTTDGAGRPRTRTATQTVYVTNERETQVQFTLNLKAKEQ